jgi:hypothetical protein
MRSAFNSRKVRFGHFVACLFLLSLAVVPASAQMSIDTISVWDGWTSISSFGVENSATYGQVIRVAAGSTALQSFAFEIGHCSASVTLRGEVYAWDGSNMKATGSALFESTTQIVPADSAYHLVTFSPGSLTLPAGDYVLFGTTSRDQSGAPHSACRWGALTTNTQIPNGSFVFINSSADPTMWTNSTWSDISQDLAMQVTGLVAPVPAAPPTGLAIGFILLVCVGLVELARRRRYCPAGSSR